MQYAKVRRAVFLERPNRFIARCRLDGEEVVAHVKNTGRCRELLVPGAIVLLEDCPKPGRKTRYSLVAVYKGSLLINMDSQAPNQAVAEALGRGLLDFADGFAREKTFGASRFDFLLTKGGETAGYLEVKGVTLEEDGVAMFPDAPTERGVKHTEELEAVAAQGLFAGLLFLIQFSPCHYFTPNRGTHPAFADAVVRAAERGVAVLAYDTIVTEDSMTLREKVEVVL